MGKALDAEERLHVCFKIITSMMSAKHFKCDLFHFRDLFKIRYNSLRCVIVFVVRKQLGGVLKSMLTLNEAIIDVKEG